MGIRTILRRGMCPGTISGSLGDPKLSTGAGGFIGCPRIGLRKRKCVRVIVPRSPWSLVVRARTHENVRTSGGQGGPALSASVCSQRCRRACVMEVRVPAIRFWGLGGGSGKDKDSSRDDLDLDRPHPGRLFWLLARCDSTKCSSAGT